ncbi:unnamed protein product [Prorocentrum cordatum]|uniref:Uncharacterized protein n=1 Tax=Prorocentrum cordatum TaxID=2364126 RepID=A0ABN9QXU9_9DINO|nr:unnamed protein product [Polarella glacialis]
MAAVTDESRGEAAVGAMQEEPADGDMSNADEGSTIIHLQPPPELEEPTVAVAPSDRGADANGDVAASTTFQLMTPPAPPEADADNDVAESTMIQPMPPPREVPPEADADGHVVDSMTIQLMPPPREVPLEADACGDLADSTTIQLMPPPREGPLEADPEDDGDFPESTTIQLMPPPREAPPEANACAGLAESTAIPLMLPPREAPAEGADPPLGELDGGTTAPSVEPDGDSLAPPKAPEPPVAEEPCGGAGLALGVEHGSGHAASSVKPDKLPEHTPLEKASSGTHSDWLVPLTLPQQLPVQEPSEAGNGAAEGPWASPTATGQAPPPAPISPTGPMSAAPAEALTPPAALAVEPSLASAGGWSPGDAAGAEGGDLTGARQAVPKAVAGSSRRRASSRARTAGGGPRPGTAGEPAPSSEAVGWAGGPAEREESYVMGPAASSGPAGTAPPSGDGRRWGSWTTAWFGPCSVSTGPRGPAGAARLPRASRHPGASAAGSGSTCGRPSTPASWGPRSSCAGTTWTGVACSSTRSSGTCSRTARAALQPGSTT